MQSFRPFGTAILIAVISLGLVLGGLSLALSETYTPAPATQTLQLATPPSAVAATQTPFILPTQTLPLTLTGTAVSPSACPPPAGWTPVVPAPGDTLESLALRYGTSAAALAQANCLGTGTLLPGALVYVPPLATFATSPVPTLYLSPFPTRTFIPCGSPYGWVRYTVQPGDNLYQIARSYGITTEQLQRANCLASSTTIIRVGQLLWVPNLPARTPTLEPFMTPTHEPTEPYTATVLPFTTTPEPTATDVPTQPPASP